MGFGNRHQLNAILIVSVIVRCAFLLPIFLDFVFINTMLDPSTLTIHGYENKNISSYKHIYAAYNSMPMCCRGYQGDLGF